MPGSPRAYRAVRAYVQVYPFLVYSLEHTSWLRFGRNNLSLKLNRYEEPDSVKKETKQCDQEGPNDSIDDSIKSDNLTM